MDIFCIGEAVIDFLPGGEPASYIRNLGGAPANVAIAVSRNGLEAGFCGKVGDDDFGRFLVSTLKENGVRYLCDGFCGSAVTTMAFVTLTGGGERSFTFARKPGADMFLTKEDVKKTDIESATVVHAGSCSLSAEPAASATFYALRLAGSMGKIVSFDVNYRNLMWKNDSKAAAEKIFEVLPYVDLLKVSQEEAAMLGGEDGFFNLMESNGLSAVVETLGPEGAVCYFKGGTLRVGGTSAKPVDTTGAGDAFWAGFLSKLVMQGMGRVSDLTEEKIKKAMEYGNVAGSLCILSKGAISSLPTRAMVEKYLEKGFD